MGKHTDLPATSEPAWLRWLLTALAIAADVRLAKAEPLIVRVALPSARTPTAAVSKSTSLISPLAPRNRIPSPVTPVIWPPVT